MLYGHFMKKMMENSDPGRASPGIIRQFHSPAWAGQFLHVSSLQSWCWPFCVHHFWVFTGQTSCSIEAS